MINFIKRLFGKGLRKFVICNENDREQVELVPEWIVIIDPNIPDYEWYVIHEIPWWRALWQKIF